MLPCGTYSRSYDVDVAVIRTRLQWGLLIVLLMILLFLPHLVSTYIMGVICSICIAMIAVLGINLLTGYCGEFNLGQAAFMGVGAYSSAYLTAEMGVSFWAAIPCAILVTIAIAVIFALPAARIKGFYLGMMTLAAQFILFYFMQHGGKFTGRNAGLYTSPPNFFSVEIATPIAWYYLIMAFTVVAIVIAKNIARSKIGRNFVAIRDNEHAAAAIGINPFATKILAFTVCSAYAGLAGALWAHYIGLAHYDHFPLMKSLWYIGMVIVGGMGSTLGPILGTVFLKGLDETILNLSLIIGGRFPELTAGLSAISSATLFGVIIILFIIYEPRGLNHRWVLLKNSYRLFPYSY